MVTSHNQYTFRPQINPRWKLKKMKADEFRNNLGVFFLYVFFVLFLPRPTLGKFIKMFEHKFVIQKFMKLHNSIQMVLLLIFKKYYDFKLTKTAKKVCVFSAIRRVVNRHLIFFHDCNCACAIQVSSVLGDLIATTESQFLMTTFYMIFIQLHPRDEFEYGHAF